jgi:hypothetical protein
MIVGVLTKNFAKHVTNTICKPLLEPAFLACMCQINVMVSVLELLLQIVVEKEMRFSNYNYKTII